MKTIHWLRTFAAVWLTSVVVGMLGCGILSYPGQPGVATNGFAKIDLEDLELDGLYVYEAVYDNRPGGKGVGALVTKFYEGARTYTANVRTNADGTVYRHKEALKAAKVQMISVPSLKQVELAPDSHVVLFVEYETSLNEVDDKHLAEETLFDFPSRVLNPAAHRRHESWLSLVKAAALERNGSLGVVVESMGVGGERYVPSRPVSVQTNLAGNSLQTGLNLPMRADLATWLEARFPKGYRGDVEFFLKGVARPIVFSLGLHTPKTAAQANYRVQRATSEQKWRDVLAQWGQL